MKTDAFLLINDSSVGLKPDRDRQQDKDQAP
jgi:hypothetical protein